MTGLTPMDSELFYVRQASQVHQSYVYLVARKGDKWFSRIMDCMGLSPIQTHHRRPDMKSIKPYILCDTWDEVAPLVRQYRQYYVGKHMAACGFEPPHYPWESENDFLEAVRTSDGGIAVSASHRPRRDSRWVQTLVTINAKTGENFEHTAFYDDEEEFRWKFKPELEAWWDSKIEQCATWGNARWSPRSRSTTRRNFSPNSASRRCY